MRIKKRPYFCHCAKDDLSGLEIDYLQCEFCELQILIVGYRSDDSCFSVIKLDWIANKWYKIWTLCSYGARKNEGRGRRMEQK
jgi:hypothetical protein